MKQRRIVSLLLTTALVLAALFAGIPQPTARAEGEGILRLHQYENHVGFAEDHFMLTIEGRVLRFEGTNHRNKDRYRFYIKPGNQAQARMEGAIDPVTHAYSGSVDVSFLAPGDYQFYLDCLSSDDTYYDTLDISADAIPLIVTADDVYISACETNRINQDAMQALATRDPLRFSDPSALFFGESAEAQLAQIRSKALEIIQSVTDDYEKLRLIHDWVAGNICYNYDQYNGTADGDNSPYGVFTSGIAQCHGYAMLTQAMLRSIGIPAVNIVGRTIYSMGRWNEDSDPNTANHVWNAAYVQGRWVLLDTTWDSSNRYENGQKYIMPSFAYSTEHAYFDPTPDAFALDHRILYTDGFYYIVSFDTQAGSPVESAIVVKGYLYDMPSGPTRPGYVFTGWYKDAACTQPWTCDMRVTADMTLYAGWALESQPEPPPPPPPAPQPEPPPQVQTPSNHLGGITLSAGALSRAFSPRTTNYTVNLGENDAAVTIVPVKAYGGAAMTIDGKKVGTKTLKLAPGKTAAMTIMVTWNKKTTTYKLMIKRPKSTNNRLSKLTASSGTWSQAFDPAVTGYRLTLPENVSKVMIKATRASSLASMSPASKAYVLKPGQTVKATVKVKAQSGATRTYAVMITRAKSTNANLSSLKVSAKGASLTPKFSKNTADYTLTLPAKTGSVSISAMAADSLSKVTINGSRKTSLTVKLTSGQSKTVTVTVTSQAGTSKSYSIVVNRK